LQAAAQLFRGDADGCSGCFPFRWVYFFRHVSRRSGRLGWYPATAGNEGHFGRKSQHRECGMPRL